MLYVCSVPEDSDWNDYLAGDTVFVYPLDCIKGDRDGLSNKAWAVYENTLGYEGIWILLPEGETL